MSLLEIEREKIKHGRCPRCGFEAGVRWKDRRKKICAKCFTSESIIEYLYLVPARYIDHEAVATLEEDYKDWVEDDGYEQEKLPKG